MAGRCSSSCSSPVTCFPVAWCPFETHSLPTSTSHVCPFVEHLFTFIFWGLKSSSDVELLEASISLSTSSGLLSSVLLFYAAVLHRAKTMGAVSLKFPSETASTEGLLNPSTSLFLLRVFTSLLEGVVVIITDSTSLSTSNPSNYPPLLEP